MEAALVVAAMVRRTPAALGVAVAALLAVACGRGNQYAPPPPPEVTVGHPVEQDVTIHGEFTGHTVAIATLDIRARVQGYLESVNFEPGARVKQGDLLFVIEPELYQAQVDQAKALLAAKEAAYRAAQEQLEITQTIFQKSAGSRTDLVAKTQARDLAKAELENARASLAAAELNLSYTHIYAPFDGVIDRNLVDVGNLVGSGSATLLATIVRYDPIFAYFQMSESELLQYRDGRGNGAGDDEAQLGLATDTDFPYTGRVDYIGNRVDPDTGTIELRAIFANPDRAILPGLFARVRVPMSHRRAILVPDAAIQSDQGGQYVLVVDEKNLAQYRRVQVGPTVEGGLRVVDAGVGPADMIVVNGLQRARPGVEVKPTQAQASQS
ncbi:MAG TPA: efflux RND transporter periplasmic adaptor subunit [Myxococcota bacterium]|nr:efflux RND transporter periplasmic adaptor subunit [Myxococcota bacterium]